MTVQEIRAKLAALSSPEAARSARRFVKTGPGDYAEGDVFIGVRAPQLRQLVKQLGRVSTKHITALLHSAVHEERMLALLLLVQRYQSGDRAQQEKLFSFYLDSTSRINCWDLVDASAGPIVGAWLYPRSRRPLYRLAQSTSVWERRIAIVSTLYFIRQGDFTDTLRLAESLMYDKHDLIHKAVGWMLREVGKRDIAAEEAFLKQHYRDMPRTMLRYAIERFPERKRQDYLKGLV
jgi:3-methyladenine DNA glycosylase AlkD